MKHNTRLIYTFDGDIGEKGWRVKRFPFFNTSDEQGLTHDILEHSRNDKGTWYEEISAFGSIIAYRGNMSDLLYPLERNIHDKIIKLSQELAGLLETPLLNNPEFFSKMNNVNKKVLNCASYWNGEYVDLLVDEASAYTVKNFNVATIEQIRSCLMSWVSYGYIRASRIIDSSGWDAPYIWEEVENTINSALFDSKLDFYEGNEVSVQIDFDRCSCDVVPINCKRIFE